MTGWSPSFNGVECGCIVFSDDQQQTAISWEKCASHSDIDFKELKRLSIEDNISNLLSAFLITTEKANELREQFYQIHGINNGV